MNNAAKPPHRMPFMLKNGQDHSLEEKEGCKPEKQHFWKHIHM